MSSTILWALAGTQFIFFMTALGASLVFFLRSSAPRFQTILPGFAGGVMTAASVWSLLLPAIGQAEAEGRLPAWLPAAAGLVLGALFLTAADALQGGAHGRGRMLFTAITLHNIPEGLTMAISLVAAGETKLKSALTALMIGMLQPLGAFLGLMMIGASATVIPLAMAMAGGTLLFVVINEILPETYGYKETEKSAFAVFAGFIVMSYLFMTIGE